MDEEQECNLPQTIECIKYGIIAKIYEAGMNFKQYDLSLRDKHGNLPPEKFIELQTRLGVTLDVYSDVVDLVWGESVDVCESDICNECRQKLEDQEIVDKLDKELKKKKDS